MSSLEKFGLIGGIIGLTVDTIAIVTYFAGLWQPLLSSTDKNMITTLLLALMGFVIFYAWFAIAWYILRSSFIKRNKEENHSHDSQAFGAAFGMGLLVLPIYIAWVIALGTASLNSVEIDLIARAEATRTASVMLTPTQVTGIETPIPTPIIQKSVQEIIRAKETEELMGYWLAGFIGFFALIVITWIVLVSLMPIVYPEMQVKSE
jgi:hypothetical protein